MANRTIFSASPAPQTWYAAVLKSLSVNLFFCFIFMRRTIVKEVFPPLWGVYPYRPIKGILAEEKALVPDDRLVRRLDDRGKAMASPRPPARAR
jgi:hypothetical protein